MNKLWQVRFSDAIAVTPTYSATEYDRSNQQQPSLCPKFIMEANRFLLDYKHHEV